MRVSLFIINVLIIVLLANGVMFMLHSVSTVGILMHLLMNVAVATCVFVFSFLHSYRFVQRFQWFGFGSARMAAVSAKANASRPQIDTTPHLRKIS